MKSLQIQAGLLDPKLLEPEKYRSGIFLETDTGAAVGILLIDASGAEQQLSGLVPAEELVRFASLDLTDYHSAIQQLWQEHPLFEEKSPCRMPNTKILKRRSCISPSGSTPLTRSPGSTLRCTCGTRW